MNNSCNVSNIIADRDLCTSCGTCEAICPTKAISLHFQNGLFVPFVEVSKCNNCQLCLKACPNYQIDLKNKSRKELIEGSAIASYTSFSNDTSIRQRGTSGGVVTQLIVSLLNKGVYDKATYLHYPKFDESKCAELNITEDIEDIKSGAKSKYLPASVNSLLKYMQAHPSEKIIITATPCQLVAIRNYIQTKHLNQDNYLFVGLFCDMTMNYNFMKYLSWKFGQYDELQYRTKENGGWPGNLSIIKNGVAKTIDRSTRIQLKPYFQLNRCRFCFDKLNREADISCGDCYIVGEESKEGKSSVIIRTEKGMEAWNLCKGDISASQCKLSDIVDSQAAYNKEINAQRGKSVDMLYQNMPHFLNSLDLSNNYKERQLGRNAVDVKGCEDLEKSMQPPKKQNKLLKYFKRLFSLFKSDNQKVLLIDHAGFVNKGAELMLRETVIKAKRFFPEYRIAIPYYEYVNNVAYCVQNDVLPMYRYGSTLPKRVKYLIANKILKKRRYVVSADISLILDVGGFQFSDQWLYDGYSEDWKYYYSQFTHPQLRLLLLPQAFGPFKSSEAQEAIRFVYSKAEVVYAREQTSYEYLKEVLPNMNKVKLMSDFTCLYKPNVSLVQFMQEKHYVTVVPNMRMLDKGDENAHLYMDMMCRIVDVLSKHGESVVLLNHEGVDDEQLCMEINERLGTSFPLLTNLTADEVKAVIGKSKLLVSSRFHGVVSGLSQGVPTFCTSWSHKYQELLNDYGVPNNLLKIDDIDGSIDKLLAALQNPSNYYPTTQSIQAKEMETMRMWSEIR